MSRIISTFSDLFLVLGFYFFYNKNILVGLDQINFRWGIRNVEIICLEATFAFSPRHRAKVRDYPPGQMDNAVFGPRFLHGDARNSRRIAIANAHCRQSKHCTAAVFVNKLTGDNALFGPRFSHGYAFSRFCLPNLAISRARSVHINRFGVVFWLFSQINRFVVLVNYSA